MLHGVIPDLLNSERGLPQGLKVMPLRAKSNIDIEDDRIDSMMNGGPWGKAYMARAARIEAYGKQLAAEARSKTKAENIATLMSTFQDLSKKLGGSGPPAVAPVAPPVVVPVAPGPSAAPSNFASPETYVFSSPANSSHHSRASTHSRASSHKSAFVPVGGGKARPLSAGPSSSHHGHVHASSPGSMHVGSSHGGSPSGLNFDARSSSKSFVEVHADSPTKKVEAFAKTQGATRAEAKQAIELLKSGKVGDLHASGNNRTMTDKSSLRKALEQVKGKGSPAAKL